MNNYVLASVGTLETFDKTSGELYFKSKTLTESSLEFSATEQEVRGGFLNGKLASYFSDSSLSLNISDALFNMNQIALQTGSTIEIGGDCMTTETVECTASGKLVVSNEAQKFANVGIIGWVSEVGADDWTKVSFDADNKTANYSGATVGTSYCVKYIKTDATAETITVSSSFVPSQCYGILTLPLFRTSESGGSGTNSKVGEVIVEIPTMQFTGSVSLSLTANGNATVPLNAVALANYDSTTCEGSTGYYAKLTKVITNADEFADVKTIVVSNSDIDLAKDATATLEVLAMYNGYVAPKKIDASKLTFTSSSTSVATVGAHTGVVTGKASGSTVIEVIVTEKPSLSAKVPITVTV